MRPLTPFVLCADDYGLTPGVSAGIRELLQDERLTATSCIVASPHWPAEGAKLRAMPRSFDVGLHLTLTQLAPLGPMPRTAPKGVLPSSVGLTVRAYLARLDRREILAEIDRQLDAFERVMGHPPDHVDGHQHVHQLPIVSDALIDRYKARLPTGTFLRVSVDPLAAIWRRYIASLHASTLACMGRRLKRTADFAGIPMNQRFAGVLNFNESIGYRDMFRRFIEDAPTGLVVMCHPGYPDATLRALDRVVETRASELAYLASFAFLHDVSCAGMCLGRFRDIACR
ncbi:MAG: ChbG/HpnK family deacetylase [Alphaproteobacteria bacterium]|nr:ChbG/HpnK family deacetylase [Alphaproteobacteria bacterium]